MILIISDFDRLYDTLAQKAAISKEVEEAAKSGAIKLRTEKYDETQMMNIGFLRKVKEKITMDKFIR